MLRLKSKFRVSLTALAGMAASFLSAQTIDFESASYSVDHTIVGVDGWLSSDAAPVTSDNFKIQSAPGNKFIHCISNTTSTIYRGFPSQSGKLDVRWRWKPNSDSISICLGASSSSGNARQGNRALTCFDPHGSIYSQGSTGVTSQLESWSTGNWYYMRMALDGAANKFSLYVANDSLRSDERVVNAAMVMAGSGAVTRIALWDENGTGSMDIDDISWENVAVWQGSLTDSLWSTGKNWSGGVVPDSLTNVIFDATSLYSILIDKPSPSVRSITVAPEYTGMINFGTAALQVQGKADFTGGRYPAASSGIVHFPSPRGQSLIGPSPGQVLPTVRHTGAGTLRLDNRNLYTWNLLQHQGSFDFNGYDLVIQGDFSVKGGTPKTLLNLDGRSISVGHNADLEGASKDTILNLQSAPMGWNIAVSKGDTLLARYAAIGNSHATLAHGFAFVSSDLGGDTGWTFVAPPGFSSQPQNQAIKVGENAIFKVGVTSKVAVTYQWLRNDSEIVGAKDSIYTLVGAKMADSGKDFSCKVSSIGGNVTSSAAKLKVTFPLPSAQPGSQQFQDSLSVSLTSQVPGTKLFYSANGAPWTLYAKPLVLKDSTYLQSYAALGPDTSGTAAWTYSKVPLAQVEQPKLVPGEGSYNDSVVVTMTAVTPGSSIYYTLDGTDPDTTKTLYNGPLTFKANATVSATGTKAGLRNSPIITNLYIVKTSQQDTIDRPTASPAGGAFSDSVIVKLSPPASSPSAQVYYVIGNGGLSHYLTPLVIRTSCVLKAISSLGSALSDTASWAFNKRMDAPSASPKGTDFDDTLRVNLISKTSGASIFYSLNGTDPVGANAKPYPSGGLLLDSAAVLKAISIKGSDTSAILSETYTLTPDTPRAVPRSGDYTSRIQIRLEASTPLAQIYYTLDGTTPGPEKGSPRYVDPFPLDTSATLRAVAVTGHDVTLRRSPLLVENYTFILPGKRTLGPGQRLDLSSNYSLSSPLLGASPVTVEIVSNDSMRALKGFQDIQFGIRLSLPEGSTAFPKIVFTGPPGERRFLYDWVTGVRAAFVTNKDTVDINSAGTYFLAVDTLPPTITLSGETFAPEDSTRVVFSIDDNVTNLLVDLERSDTRGGFTKQPFGSPDVVKLTMKNPDGSIQPMTVKLRVDDHSSVTDFPVDSNAAYPVAQRITSPTRSPAVFKIGNSASDPWDLVTIPLSMEKPMTVAQLRRNNGVTSLMGAAWDDANGKYRIVGEDENILPGAAIWLENPASLPSLVFPSLQTIPLQGKGGFQVTLHKGWNLTANPTLTTLYWPVPRSQAGLYDQSSIKAPYAYDAATEDFVFSDSLLPWRGYFVYSRLNRDTTVDLLSKPAAETAFSKSAAKASAAALSSGNGLSFQLHLKPLTPLRLGATPTAENGISIEDEPLPPPRDGNVARLWSARESAQLGTDLVKWAPGGLMQWKVVAGLPAGRGNLEDTSAAETEGATIDNISLPQGYAAWAVSRKRGLRFLLKAGAGIPLYPGFTDSLDVVAGPAAELDARLASIPTKVAAFDIGAAATADGFTLRLSLPQAAHLRWTLWTVDGRLVDKAAFDLPEGIYTLANSAHGGRAGRYRSGIYLLGLEWSVASGAAGSGRGDSGRADQGRITRKLAIP